MYGVHLAHKVGDLVRVKKNVLRSPRRLGMRGALGVVSALPNPQQLNIFIKVYIFKNNIEEWFSPSEIDIISNIDE